MARKLAARFHYVPCQELEGRRHVMLDGAPRPGTAATLSHWPVSPTAAPYGADASAEIVLKALRNPRYLPRDVDIATVDHYDADGAISLALAVLPGLAQSHGDLLAAAAHAGDFDVVTSRSAAAIAFALSALGGAAEALELMPSLAAASQDHEGLWSAEMSAYDASLDMRARGAIDIEEVSEVDLAIVRIDMGDPVQDGAQWGGSSIHPAAVHSATTCSRVATIAGGELSMRFRYETWVRLATRRPRLRVDLADLAEVLGDAESDHGRWAFDGARAITPQLRRVDGAPSTIDPERFLQALVQNLRLLDAGPPAWDPYAMVAMPLTG